MFESVIGFFLFFSNWVSPGDIGNISVEHVENRNDSTYIEFNTNYRWQEVGTKIVDSGIPLKFSYEIVVDDYDTTTYIKKLKYSTKTKKYTLSRSDKNHKNEFNNLFSALDEMKKIMFATKKITNQIFITIQVKNIKVKGIKDPIDLSEICGGGHFTKKVTKEELYDKAK